MFGLTSLLLFSKSATRGCRLSFRLGWNGILRNSLPLHYRKALSLKGDIHLFHPRSSAFLRLTLFCKDNSYLYCAYANINVRKTTGNANKILAAWEKFVDKLYSETVRLYQEGTLHKNASEYYNVADKL